MTYDDEIKDLQEDLAEAIQAQGLAIARTRVRSARQIDEQESDLDNAREDLENEKALTKKLKALLDGGLVELVGELVSEQAFGCTTHCCGYESTACNSVKKCSTRDVLTKAKEVMPS